MGSGISCCDLGPRSSPDFCPTSGCQQLLPTGGTDPLGLRLSVRSVPLARGGGSTHGDRQLPQERLQAVASPPAATQHLPGIGSCKLSPLEAPSPISPWVNHSVISDSLRPHGLQLARLLCPWDSPSKNTGVGCHEKGPQPFSRGSSQHGIP